jgi:hypothetical protein
MARDDRLQHAPSRRRCGRSTQITELVEHKQRGIAGALEVPVPDAHLLLAVGRADAGIHVERDASLAADGRHEPCRSIGRIDRQAPRGSSLRQAIASRSVPFGLPTRRIPRPPCHRRSSALPDLAKPLGVVNVLVSGEPTEPPAAAYRQERAWQSGGGLGLAGSAKPSQARP